MVRHSIRCFSIIAGTILAQAQSPVRTESTHAPVKASLNKAALEPTDTRSPQVPLLGYLASDSPLSVRPIVGAPGAVVVGDPISLPDDVTRFLPVPGQQFGLVERSGATELGVLQLGITNSSPVQAIPNTFAHADRVVFSPSGTVALLYSATLLQAQVVTGLPSSAQIARALDLTTLVLPVTSLAVSDDAHAVLIGVSDGTSGSVWLFAGGQPPQQLVSLGVPTALRFLAGKQDAIVADSAWHQISRLTDVTQQFDFRVLAGLVQGISAPADLEVSKDQRRVLVADGDVLFSIDLSSAVVKTTICPFVPVGLTKLGDQSVYLVASQDGASSGLWAPDNANAGMWLLPRAP